MFLKGLEEGPSWPMGSSVTVLRGKSGQMLEEGLGQIFDLLDLFDEGLGLIGLKLLYPHVLDVAGDVG